MRLSQWIVGAISIIFVTMSVDANAGTLTTIYSFTGSPDDAGNPQGPLTYQKGELYGTTPAGVVNYSGNGTVFKVNASTGAFKVVYSFKGGADGFDPFDGVIYHNGLLYGTTESGGGSGCMIAGQVVGCGTIFSINLNTGAETVLYSFSQDPNASPAGPGELVYLDNVLYGTTSAEGANGHGSVFSFDLTSGAYRTLYSFTGGEDGGSPSSSLLYNKGLLYGTTTGGGKGCIGLHGCGVVFSINPGTGSESVLHTFGLDKGGKIPESNLVYYAHSLIGDTAIGGDRQNYRRGEGVSFLINAKTGHEKVLDTFVTRSQSYSGLILVGSSVYETLQTGSTGNGELDQFDIKTGQQTVLYQFTGSADGANPIAPLTYDTGTFYGTTFSGGKYGCFSHQGCGTVFKYVP